MKPFKFIHTADLHLDTPFSGLFHVNPDAAERLYDATFQAFDSVVSSCIERNVDFLVISGDIYNSREHSLKAQLRFKAGMERLNENEISAYISFGNHDPLDGWSAHIEWPENVFTFSGKKVESYKWVTDGQHVADIYGISYHKRNIKENLSRKFPQETDSSIYNIGLLHCNVGGDTGHQPYAPCTLSDLTSGAMNYWALGHIHAPQVLRKSDPAVVYSGSPQGLNPKDTGPRGCYLVSVDSNGNTEEEFLPLDSIRWEVAEVCISGIETEQDLMRILEEQLESLRESGGGRPVICRIILSGRGVLHFSLIKDRFTEDLTSYLREQGEGEIFVWVDKIVDTTAAPIDRAELRKRNDFTSDLIAGFDRLLDEPESAEELKEILAPLFSSQNGRKFLTELTFKDLASLLSLSESMCLDHLAGDQSV